MSDGVIRPMVFVVLRRADEVLVWTGFDEHGAPYHRLIGGGVEPGETAIAAAAREVREELGAELRDLRFLGVVEDIFRSRGRLHHELAIVFDASFADGAWHGRDSARMLDRPEVEVGWRSLAGGSSTPLYPQGVLDLLRLPEPGYIPATVAG